MGDAHIPQQESAAARDARLRRRAQVLRDLAEARALRKRMAPRKARLERERELVHAALLRRSSTA